MGARRGRRRAIATTETPTDTDTLRDQILEAWRANQRINLMLIDWIDDEGTACALSTRDVLDGVPKRRTFKRGVIPYLGYFIAHESHHRGSILPTLKQHGQAPPQDLRLAIWDWDRI